MNLAEVEKMMEFAGTAIDRSIDAHANDRACGWNVEIAQAYALLAIAGALSNIMTSLEEMGGLGPQARSARIEKLFEAHP